ncbi:TetR/AcrR family transcriptional regulator [Thermomonospora umbrina]|uniref:TetR family transcriptional regulator n=1 Tax=Thermomonospora umbrina TaxID=111806 RepID=A0A3D9SYD3_9ACTN|nr:TetR/AcrR family transcriptional regulator [Thermomonospora umbrina]REF00859.1 TetR family transcriptional regulator [Thermomonospora umbrina]
MSDPETERLIGTATRMFAELGFDGTSTRLIADAAGVDMPTLLARVGTKPQLYRAVMHRADEAEREALRSAVAVYTPSRQGIIELADAYLDFHASHPHVMALWLHRWMGDAADVPGLEDLYTRPLSTLVAETVRDQVPDDVDPDYLVWTVVWCVFGFLSGGILYSDPERTAFRRSRGEGLGPGEPTALADFRRHLHTLVDRLFTPVDRERD